MYENYSKNKADLGLFFLLLDARSSLVLFSSFNLPNISREAKKFLCFSYRLLGRLVKVFKVIVCLLLKNPSKRSDSTPFWEHFSNEIGTRKKHNGSQRIYIDWRFSVPTLKVIINFSSHEIIKPINTQKKNKDFDPQFYCELLDRKSQ